MSNLRKFGTVAVVTLVAIGCGNDSNSSGPKRGPKAQMSVLGNEIATIEIKVGTRTIPCVLVDGPKTVAVSCDWGQQ